MGIEKEVEIWYAMRATYRREPDAMHLLKKENLGCFIPMQYKICIKKGKKVRALVPVVHNLLFVHARPSDVQRVKSQVTYLQYITDTRSGQKIIVPDGQMQRFIAVSGTYDDHLLYFQPDELNLSKGTKVRITGGEFEGQEGDSPGLREQFEAGRSRPAEESRETALTCCHDALIDKYLEKIGAGTSKAHPRKTGTDCSAYYSGMGDGRSISLNRQIKGGGI